MSWHLRVRRRLRILPGLWLNVAKRGVSVSAGIRGLTFNSRGRTTASLPGMGLSAVSTTRSGQAEPRPPVRALFVVVLVAVFAACVWVARS